MRQHIFIGQKCINCGLPMLLLGGMVNRGQCLGAASCGQCNEISVDPYRCSKRHGHTGPHETVLDVGAPDERERR